MFLCGERMIKDLAKLCRSFTVVAFPLTITHARSNLWHGVLHVFARRQPWAVCFSAVSGAAAHSETWLVSVLSVRLAAQQATRQLYTAFPGLPANLGFPANLELTANLSAAAAGFGRYHRPPPSSRTPKSTLSMRRYRQRLRENPDLRREYRARQVANQRRYMARKKEQTYRGAPTSDHAS